MGWGDVIYFITNIIFAKILSNLHIRIISSICIIYSQDCVLDYFLVKFLALIALITAIINSGPYCFRYFNSVEFYYVLLLLFTIRTAEKKCRKLYHDYLFKKSNCFFNCRWLQDCLVYIKNDVPFLFVYSKYTLKESYFTKGGKNHIYL